MVTAKQVDAVPVLSFPDPRRLSERQPGESRLTDRSKAPFTANAAGTTTTIVGANAAPATNDNNIARRGEKFQLYTSAGVLKEETVFEVTNISGTTTLTFAPSAAVATASGDIARWIHAGSLDSIESMDARLVALGFDSQDISRMTMSDKQFAILKEDSPGTGL